MHHGITASLTVRDVVAGAILVALRYPCNITKYKKVELLVHDVIKMPSPSELRQGKERVLNPGLRYHTIGSISQQFGMPV